MIQLIAPVILIVLFGGFGIGERSRTPIVPAPAGDVIPHTLDVTNWGGRKPGDRINLEVDMMARYAARLAEARAGGY